MSFRLFVDSANGVTLEPEYDYVNERTKIEDRDRTRDGSEFVYKWSAFDRINFSINYVNSEVQSIVNSWWESNTDLLFKDENATQVYSMHLVNESRPVGSFVKPYTSLWSGKIELEGY